MRAGVSPATGVWPFPGACGALVGHACHPNEARTCSTFVEPILITPTQRKDYRNPHVTKVWTLAGQALRSAGRAIIVGHSLPDDDLDVIHLLKRGLGQFANQSPESLTVVEKATDDAMRSIAKYPVWRRYRSIFGPNLDWY